MLFNLKVSKKFSKLFSLCFILLLIDSSYSFINNGYFEKAKNNAIKDYIRKTPLCKDIKACENAINILTNLYDLKKTINSVYFVLKSLRVVYKI